VKNIPPKLSGDAKQLDPAVGKILADVLCGTRDRALSP
jgi:hypothetical protein